MEQPQTVADIQQRQMIHQDPRLTYSSNDFKKLEHIKSVSRRSLQPTQGQGNKGSGYTANSTMNFKLQSSSAHLDRHQSYLKFKVSLTGTEVATDGASHTGYVYAPSAGGMSFLDQARVDLNDKRIDTIDEGSRYYESMVVGSTTQNHYETELTATAKVWKHIKDDAEREKMTLHWSNSKHTDDYVEVLVHLDNIAFFRQLNMWPLTAETDVQITLPSNAKVMEKLPVPPTQTIADNDWKNLTGTAKYELWDVEMNLAYVFPTEEILNPIYEKMYVDDAGLTMIQQDNIETHTRDIPSGSNSVQINFNISKSNVRGFMAMVVPKNESVNSDNVYECGLPNLERYSVSVQGEEVLSNNEFRGLSEAYYNYRLFYEESSDSYGRSMLNHDDFKNHHTLMCINTRLLNHLSGSSVLENGISTKDAGSNVMFKIKLTDGNNFPANSQLLLYVLYNSLVRIRQRIVDVGV